MDSGLGRGDRTGACAEPQQWRPRSNKRPAAWSGRLRPISARSRLPAEPY